MENYFEFRIAEKIASKDNFVIECDVIFLTSEFKARSNRMKRAIAMAAVSGLIAASGVSSNEPAKPAPIKAGAAKTQPIVGSVCAACEHLSNLN